MATRLLRAWWASGFLLMAFWTCGCPISGGDSGHDALDSGRSGADSRAQDGVTDDSPSAPNGQDITEKPGDSVSSESTGTPCIAVNPAELSFGGVQCLHDKTVELAIESCGSVPLELYDIALAADSHPAFSLDLSGLANLPTPETPLTIPPGAAVSVQVVFAPTEASPVDAAGQIVLFEATVRVASSSGTSPDSIAVNGASVILEAPEAVIECAEGNEVVPGTVLHLSGNTSFQQCGQEGAVAKWEWDVERPEGSASQFVPSSSHPTPTFEVDLAGTYAFYLVVYDLDNTPSCCPAEYEVAVVPDETIRIELFWHTPADPDENDQGPEASADLDLHFLHPDAAGPDLDGDGSPEGWFDIPWDCFWCNPDPDWPPPGPAGNPSYVGNGNGQPGPEAIAFGPMEPGLYKIGVHYWDDHGYGPSIATVRVWIYGMLVFESADVELQMCQVWEVAYVEDPSGKVSLINDVGGRYKLTPPWYCGYLFCP